MIKMTKKEDDSYPAKDDKRSLIEYAKSVYRTLRKEIVYNLILYPFVKNKHNRLNQDVERSQEHTYTAFYRSPGQISALMGKVMDYILNNPDRPAGEILQINVLSGSMGAEAYTLASLIMKKYPQLNFHIHCSDLHEHMILKAKMAEYSISEVGVGDISEGFIQDTFDLKNGCYHVKGHIKNKVTFCQANIVADKLTEKHPIGDLLFIQNVLFHLDENDSNTAFHNALTLVKDRCVIFMDGMSLDQRVELTRDANLKPLDYRLKEIHDHARIHVPDDWWNYYYGAEPYLFFKKDRVRRYSTIFMR